MVQPSALRRSAGKRLFDASGPDINVITFRGLVDTRLVQARRWRGGCNAARLCRTEAARKTWSIPTELLDPSDFPGTRAGRDLRIESRIGDARVNDLLEAINHRKPSTPSAANAFLGALDGSCRTPIAGHATVDADAIRFAGMILTPDGSRWHDVEIEGSRTMPPCSARRPAGPSAARQAPTSSTAGPEPCAFW